MNGAMNDRVNSILDSTVRRTRMAVPKSLIWVGLGVASWGTLGLGVAFVGQFL